MWQVLHRVKQLLLAPRFARQVEGVVQVQPKPVCAVTMNAEMTKWRAAAAVERKRRCMFMELEGRSARSGWHFNPADGRTWEPGGVAYGAN